jgi:hypothetical protein
LRGIVRHERAEMQITDVTATRQRSCGAIPKWDKSRKLLIQNGKTACGKLVL